MTQEQTIPVPATEAEEQSKAEEPKKPRLYSEEEWNKNQSKLDKRVAAAERERDAERQRVQALAAEVQGLKDDLELSGLTDEDERTARRTLAQSRRELTQRQETLAAAEQELGRRAREHFAETIAAQYGVPKEDLLEFTTVAEMKAAGLEAENARLKAEKEKPAPIPRRRGTGQDTGESVKPGKGPLEMSADEFNKDWERQKRAALR